MWPSNPPKCCYFSLIHNERSEDKKNGFFTVILVDLEVVGGKHPHTIIDSSEATQE